MPWVDLPCLQSLSLQTALVHTYSLYASIATAALHQLYNMLKVSEGRQNQFLCDVTDNV